MDSKTISQIKNLKELLQKLSVFPEKFQEQASACEATYKVQKSQNPSIIAEYRQKCIATIDQFSSSLKEFQEVMLDITDDAQADIDKCEYSLHIAQNVNLI
jgi:hypothetical protein